MACYNSEQAIYKNKGEIIMCWCNPNLRTPCCGKPDCNPPQHFKTKYEGLSKVKEPKEAMKEKYQQQAETISQVMVSKICNQFAEVLNGKQMLQVQTIMKEGIKVDKILDMIVDFIIEDAKLADQEIGFVVDYMNTDVAQRVVKSNINLQFHFLENKEKFAEMIMTTEVLEKIERIVK